MPTLRDLHPLLRHESTRCLARWLHQIAPTLGIDSPCRLAGAYRAGPIPQEIEDRLLQCLIGGRQTLAPTAIRAVAHLFPGPCPRLAPPHGATTAGTCLGVGSHHYSIIIIDASHLERIRKASASSGALDVVIVTGVDPTHESTQFATGVLDRMLLGLGSQRPELGRSRFLIGHESLGE